MVPQRVAAQLALTAADAHQPLLGCEAAAKSLERPHQLALLRVPLSALALALVELLESEPHEQILPKKQAKQPSIPGGTGAKLASDNVAFCPSHGVRSASDKDGESAWNSWSCDELYSPVNGHRCRSIKNSFGFFGRRFHISKIGAIVKVRMRVRISPFRVRRMILRALVG